jgi:hypothetical protein
MNYPLYPKGMSKNKIFDARSEMLRERASTAKGEGKFG